MCDEEGNRIKTEVKFIDIYIYIYILKYIKLYVKFYRYKIFRQKKR